ncbi:hypothetical protein H310_05743 [Aphanomyces invadans]|uniref:Uncharacterized protein n=1 Tax=Aphanomyces invadans TaxID=157072 RepID=A0A024U7H5_9STRA|nr:hypothetical protein H310_05743 [Aphanomyces invadans]ETW02175.1 hypothetical protein H310_05743 [Aphanomyces invadans]|eukprot:XP_008868780.1 hypothetical protein H310_05743 [Aphanomyces invadans]
MGHRAVSTKVAVPPILGGVMSRGFLDTRFQHVQAFFTLGTADDFTNLRDKHVASRDSLVVFVQAHVERLDLLGVVVQHDGLLVDLLRDESLVLAAEVVAPLWLDLKLALLKVLRLVDQFDGVRVRQADKRRSDRRLETVD